MLSEPVVVTPVTLILVALSCGVDNVVAVKTPVTFAVPRTSNVALVMRFQFQHH